MSTYAKKELLNACEKIESEFDTIAMKTLFDPSENHNDIDVFVMRNKRTGSIGLSVIFPCSGIYRSRPALSATVDTAVNAIWEQAYHTLFGDEALDYIPAELLVEQACIIKSEHICNGAEMR